MSRFNPLPLIAGISIFLWVGNLDIAVAQNNKPEKITPGISTPRLIGALPPALLEEDPRLKQKRVQLVAARIYLQELFTLWTEQTGVSFEARDNPQDDSGRWRVMICLRDAVSVGDAMDALRSAMSQQGATWEWHRTGVAPNFAYRLVRPASLEKVEASIKAEVQADYERQFELAKKGLKMSPGELKSAIRTDDTGMLALMGKDSNIQDGLRLFTSNFNSEQQRSVIQDNQEVRISVDHLDVQGKAFTEKLVQEVANLNRGRNIDFGPPKEVTVKTRWVSGLPNPSLVISQDGIGGWAYIGGVPVARRWQEKLAKRAFLNGDEKTIPSNLLSQKIEAPPLSQVEDAEKVTADISDHDLLAAVMLDKYDAEKSLFQLASAQSPHINFVARLAQKSSIKISLPDAYEKTVGQFLETLHENSIATKWRNNILVLGFTGGFAVGDNVMQTPPYALPHFFIERLTGYSKAQSIPLADMVALTKIATREQIVALDKEQRNVFPFLYWIISPKTYDLLGLIGKKPGLAEELESDTEVLVSELTPDLRMALSIPASTPPDTRLVVRQAYGYTTLVPPPAGTICSFILQNNALTSEANAKPNVVFQFGYMTPRSPKELVAEQKKESDAWKQRQSRRQVQ